MVYFHKTDQLKVKSKMNKRLIEKKEPTSTISKQKNKLSRKSRTNSPILLSS